MRENTRLPQGTEEGFTALKDPATGEVTSLQDRYRAITVGASVAGATILTGDGNIVVSKDGSFATMGAESGALEEEIFPEDRALILSEDRAFERIGAAALSSLKQLELNQQKAREESSQSFRFTIIFSALGFLVVLSGAALLLFEQTAAGVVSTIASIIPATVALIFSKKDAELRATIQEYHSYMLELQRVLTMIDVAETIQNANEKDRMKTEIIYRSLSIQEANNEMA